MICRQRGITAACIGVALAVSAMSLGAVDITIRRPYSRWLFGGLGFQNSEANLVPIMSDEFRVERAQCY